MDHPIVLVPESRFLAGHGSPVSSPGGQVSKFACAISVLDHQFARDIREAFNTGVSDENGFCDLQAHILKP
jgi:hypothetical protein